VCANVLAGALVGHLHAEGKLKRECLTWLIAGLILIAAAVLLNPICPIIKNIWTSTFALFSSGFSLAALGALMPVSQAPGVRPLLAPARIFGENPLLAYILVFLIAPVIDAAWFGEATSPMSLRNAGQAWFERFASPNAASLLFGACGLLLLLVVLYVCHRKRWILKL